MLSLFCFIFLSLLFATWVLGKDIVALQDVWIILLESLVLLWNLWIANQRVVDIPVVLAILSPHLFGLWIISIVYILDWNESCLLWPRPSLSMLLVTTVLDSLAHILARLLPLNSQFRKQKLV